MKASEMTESELHRAAENMEDFGGGFAAAIALAYFRADSHNKPRIVQAFAELFEKFGAMK